MSSTQVIAFFITTIDSGRYKCNICGCERKQAPRSGFTNLASHLAANHSTYRDEYDELKRCSLTPLEVFGFVDAAMSDLYDWMRLLVDRNLPLSEVENSFTRRLVKMGPTTTETLRTFMRRVAKRVGCIISNEMGDTFGLMFDGWSAGTLHFVAVVVVYQVDDERRERMIGLSPLKHGQSADAHIEHLTAILVVYNKSISLVKFLAGDNCATNQSVPKKLGVPLIGCASHRFNLTVIRYLADSNGMIAQTQKLMTHLRLPNNAAELARHTHLRAVRHIATRWSSVFDMFDRYLMIRDAAVKVEAVEELMPRGASHHRIVALHVNLRELDNVCSKLQRDGRTLAEVRALFDACIEKSLP